MISAQNAFKRLSQGKPVSTFPDHALKAMGIAILGKAEC
jgi:hypothetical protein